jgi:hypothetical protein
MAINAIVVGLFQLGLPAAAKIGIRLALGTLATLRADT